MSLVEELYFTNCKPDDWDNPFQQFNLKTPYTVIAQSIANIITRLEKGSDINTDNCDETRSAILKHGYGWPDEAINLFNNLIKTYPKSIIPKLQKYKDDYQDYYGGAEKIQEYLTRCQNRYKKKLGEYNN